MFETSFDSSMLGQSNIIVHCPDRVLADELMEILDANSIRWHGGASVIGNSQWEVYDENTCYWIEGYSLMFGDVYCVDGAYKGYIKCTFCGADTTDFDIVTDEEFQSFLGFERTR